MLSRSIIEHITYIEVLPKLTLDVRHKTLEGYAVGLEELALRRTEPRLSGRA